MGISTFLCVLYLLSQHLCLLEFLLLTYVLILHQVLYLLQISAVLLGGRLSVGPDVLEVVLVPEGLFLFINNLCDTAAFQTLQVLMDLLHVLVAHVDLLGKGSRGGGGGCLVFILVILFYNHIGFYLVSYHLGVFLFGCVSFKDFVFPIKMLCFGHLVLLDLVFEDP